MADPSRSLPALPQRALGRQSLAWPSRFGSLAHRDFRLLVAGTVLTQMGQWMQMVALGWLVLDLTGSAFYLGLAGFLRSIPQLILSIPGGILADRMDREKLLGATQAWVAGFTLLLAVLISTGLVRTWHVMVLTFVVGSGMAMLFPVRQAIVSDTVPRKDLANAVAVNSAANNVTRMLGPAVAGVLISFVGVAVCFYLQAAGLVLGLWTSLAMKIPARSEDQKKALRARSPVADIVEAFRYIRKNRVIIALIVAATIPAVLGMPYVSFLPMFARNYDIGASGLGLLMVAVGLGSIVGSVGYAAAGDFARKGLVQTICIFLFGVSLVAFSFVTWVPGALVLLFLAGAMSGTYMAVNMTLLQTLVPGELRGRVISVFMMLSWGMQPLGTLPLGVLADHFGAWAAVSLGGALCAVCAVLLAVSEREMLEAR